MLAALRDYLIFLACLTGGWLLWKVIQVAAAQ